jgi:hypothetical protein
MMTVDRFREVLAAGPYAWPGAYPLYFITGDGEPLSFAAALAQKDKIEAALAKPGSDIRWQVTGIEINYEDASLYCNHTGKRIESAYAEPEIDHVEP